MGLISDEATEIIYWRNLSGRNMTLGSFQPLTEMSNNGSF
jgi:hypothetical protein